MKNINSVHNKIHCIYTSNRLYQYNNTNLWYKFTNHVFTVMTGGMHGDFRLISAFLKVM